MVNQLYFVQDLDVSIKFMPAIRKKCPTNNTWIGGFEKGYGNHEPLYLQCCEFENLDQLSDSMFTSITIRPGEYFEGEEVTKIEGIREKIVSFDFISSMEMIKQGPPNNQSLAFVLKIRRFYCDRFQKPKLIKSWSWP
uniref:Uncharacterized protein n=1 Tax=Panagrolaimus sp. JU765 TaxID=591449 RepID=A0AC34QTK2_9BILA